MFFLALIQAVRIVDGVRRKSHREISFGFVVDVEPGR